MKLIITGFMGAGKTTLLKKWEKDFPGPAFDLDHLVAQAVGAAPDELGDWIESRGFEEFRKRETAIIRDFLKGEGRGLLALGGGAFHIKNRKLWSDKREVYSLWLRAPLDLMWQRVRDKTHRPLVKEGREAFKALYEERIIDYQEADFELDAQGEFPDFSVWCADSKIDE